MKITEDVRKYANDLIARAKKVKLLLQRADRSKCLDLEDCGKAFLARSVKKTMKVMRSWSAASRINRADGNRTR